MANKAHLKILRQGVEAWNAWRREHPDIIPDLREANLYKTDLSEANLSEANLSKADLSEANLSGANLSGASLEDAKLCKAKLVGANLSKAELFRAKMAGAELFGADLREAKLSEAELDSANLSGTDLRKAALLRTHLCGADLSGANLSGASLEDTKLCKAKLAGADLSGADLTWADLSAKVNLFRANLHKAKLFRADLSRADLSGADLSGADLRRTKLHQASLEGAQVDNTTLAFANLTRAVYAPVSPPPNSNLEGITGLATSTFPPGQNSGLVQLRKLLQEAGLRAQEQEATRAIERTTVKHLLYFKLRSEPKEESIWRKEPLASLYKLYHRVTHFFEGLFRWSLFGLTVDYGLKPGRALRILFLSFTYFSIIYFIALYGGTWNIYEVCPAGRVDPVGRVADKAMAWPQRPSELKEMASQSLLFSLISTFNVGWNWLDVGNWVNQLQTDECTLRAIGWVRVASGSQSLLSIYLLAIWALTYFGRPFG